MSRGLRLRSRIHRNVTNLTIKKYIFTLLGIFLIWGGKNTVFSTETQRASKFEGFLFWVFEKRLRNHGCRSCWVKVGENYITHIFWKIENVNNSRYKISRFSRKKTDRRISEKPWNFITWIINVFDFSKMWVM